MNVNKIVVNGETLIDLTESTIDPSNVLQGCIGFNAKGERFVGEYVPTSDSEEKESGEFLESGTFTVPAGVTSIEVHLVGGGAGGPTAPNGVYGDSSEIAVFGYIGGGSGYTKTVTLEVVPGETLDVTVGDGGAKGEDGEASTIKRGSTILAQADGGKTSGDGGSGGGAAGYKYLAGTQGPIIVSGVSGGNDGNDGKSYRNSKVVVSLGGVGQGYTTRDFGEATGWKRCTGGAGSNAANDNKTDKEANSGNGGNAPDVSNIGADGTIETQATAGSSGIVLIRWAAA